MKDNLATQISLEGLLLSTGVKTPFQADKIYCINIHLHPNCNDAEIEFMMDKDTNSTVTFENEDLDELLREIQEFIDSI